MLLMPLVNEGDLKMYLPMLLFLFQMPSLKKWFVDGKYSFKESLYAYFRSVGKYNNHNNHIQVVGWTI